MPRPAADSSRLAGATTGLCGYARSTIRGAHLDLEADALVLTSSCDQRRRVAELAEREADRPVFLLNLPATWQSVASQELYLAELERLGRFLVRLGGETPSPDRLAEVMLDHDLRRTKLRGLRGSLSPRRFAEAILGFHRTGEVEDAPAGAPHAPTGVPLALVGESLLETHLAIFELVEASGGHVALDATDSGERTLPAPFDRRAIAGAPLLALADAYFGSIPAVFRRPNNALYRWLKRELEERGIRGILFKRYVWCDLWHAEAKRMSEWAGVPLVEIDTDEQPLDGQLLTRIASLVEVLS